MSTKTQVKYAVKNLFLKSRHGSYASQHDACKIALHFIDQLFRLGYKIPHIHSLKQKHIIAVVNLWKAEKLSNGTMKIACQLSGIWLWLLISHALHLPILIWVLV